ncbi:hypothetical protein OC835_002926 [Tilletia horrida]|nr:hypothetical protein OC835_002926 [Tilletia horrida]
MCGIICVVHSADVAADAVVTDALKQTCERRGPDAQATVTHRVPLPAESNDAAPLAVSLHASVLSLRGQQITPQPLRSAQGFLLAWNGQIFGRLNEGDDAALALGAMGIDPLLDPAKNDGQELLRLLEQSVYAPVEDLGPILAGLLRTVEGPYAFVLVDTVSNRLYFGRDPLGRRSLLMQRQTPEDTPSLTSSPRLLICSVADAETIANGSSLMEVDCGSIWSVDLESNAWSEPVAISRGLEPLQLCDLKDEQDSIPPTPFSRLFTAQSFQGVLEDSVRRRVTSIRPYTSSDKAHVAVLFSGGLDCSTIALLAHQHISPAQPIDLLNVALENPRSLQAAARNGGGAKADAYDVPDRQTGMATYAELKALAPGRRWNFVKVDVSYAEYCAAKDEIRATMHPSNSVSIAAALFFAARGRGTLLDSGEAHETPARILLSGLGADELLGGYSRHRAAFQRGGKAALVQEVSLRPTPSQRTPAGWLDTLTVMVRIAHQLQLDLDRLPTRNLGRDDRILSTHAKEARYPFLDRSVLAFLCSLRADDKMLFDPPEFSPLSAPAAAGPDRTVPYPGDKLLLRLVAGELLRLQGAARLKKRAIQFGSRSAKMEIEAGRGKVKGHQELSE